MFLDAHCEANVGWLEPMLEEIVKDEKTVVTPIIDILKEDSLEYVGAPVNRGGKVFLFLFC